MLREGDDDPTLRRTERPDASLLLLRVLRTWTRPCLCQILSRTDTTFDSPPLSAALINRIEQLQRR